jgi:hypothetical protein
MDFPSSTEDDASEMQGNKSVKEKLKIHRDTDNAQTRHYINHNIGVPKKVNNQYRYEPVNVQEDNAKPKNIPTIINGCVSASKDEKVSYLNELYVKLLSSKNSLSKASKHKVLLIGDSHLRGYSENIKLHLNDQFQE